jgi:hypothetical protein
MTDEKRPMIAHIKLGSDVVSYDGARRDLPTPIQRVKTQRPSQSDVGVRPEGEQSRLGCRLILKRE